MIRSVNWIAHGSFSRGRKGACQPGSGSLPHLVQGCSSPSSSLCEQYTPSGHTSQNHSHRAPAHKTPQGGASKASQPPFDPRHPAMEAPEISFAPAAPTVGSGAGAAGTAGLPPPPAKAGETLGIQPEIAGAPPTPTAGAGAAAGAYTPTAAATAGAEGESSGTAADADVTPAVQGVMSGGPAGTVAPAVYALLSSFCLATAAALLLFPGLVRA